MKIVVDDKIPYISPAIESIADDVLFVPGAEFCPETIVDADALIIRTRTKCNRELLEGSKVRFIATATIGYDHIDTEYCRNAGICWTNAPGCNSSSVAQYIESCFALMEISSGKPLAGKTIGIIGVGNVGAKVKVVAEDFGMHILLNDPPRAEKEGNTGFTDLKELAGRCDIITFHIPLYREGKYKTWHLANELFFESLGTRQPIIINTSRGEVIRTGALLEALETGQVSGAIIDVWENEPDINIKLLQQAFISTPHIAGYSADGKANATRMSLESLCRFFNIPANFHIAPPAPENNQLIVSSMNEAILRIYDPGRDSFDLCKNPGRFEWLRENYPLRREKQAYEISIC